MDINSRIRKGISMSICKDCKHCDLKKLAEKHWYCNNTDVIISPVSIFDLPFDTEHSEYCFELKEKD